MIKVLDTTVRSGGFRNNWNLTDDFVKGIYTACIDGGIDYMEVGYLTGERAAAEASITREQFGPWRFCKESDLRRVFGDNKTSLKLAAMCDVGLITAEDIHAGQLVYDSPQGEQLKVIDLAMSDKVCALCGDVKLDSEEGGYLPQPCQCDDCGAAAWCSPACRDKHAALHGMTCRFVRPLLRALRERHAGFVGGPEAYEPVEWTEGINLLTLLGSICLRAQHLGLEGASTQTAVRSSLYTDILAMVSNLGLWPPGTRHEQLLGLWAA